MGQSMLQHGAITATGWDSQRYSIGQSTLQHGTVNATAWDSQRDANYLFLKSDLTGTIAGP